MGFKFPNLHPTGTVRYGLTGFRLPGAPADVVLILKHAGKGNVGWERAKRKIDAQMKAQSGSASGEAYVEACITPFCEQVVDGWEHVWEDGKPVAAVNPKKVEELIRGLIEAGGIDLVDGAIGYALNRANFRDYAPSAADDVGKE